MDSGCGFFVGVNKMGVLKFLVKWAIIVGIAVASFPYIYEWLLKAYFFFLYMNWP